MRYTGKFQSGRVFDKTNGCLPLIFEIGGGMVVPEFENAVTVMRVVEKRYITISAENAIGLGPSECNICLQFRKDFIRVSCAFQKATSNHLNANRIVQGLSHNKNQEQQFSIPEHCDPCTIFKV
ncbi:MAG: FKBP-type peptidyl-prolyl cis-trans isomerase [Desulfobacterales bacterium]